MTTEFDLAGVNDRGVYAICYDDGSEGAREFTQEILAEGGTLRRMPRADACALYLVYLKATWPEFAALYDEPSISVPALDLRATAPAREAESANAGKAWQA